MFEICVKNEYTTEFGNLYEGILFLSFIYPGLKKSESYDNILNKWYQFIPSLNCVRSA